jgi:uncharacterized membrane protein
MISEKKLKLIMAILLQISIVVAVFLVLTGGIIYLWQHGQDPLELHIAANANYSFSLFSIWHSAILFSPLGLIQLGMLVLVLAQVLRVGLLCGYYTYIRDYWFMAFSYFILGVILYSLIWQ